MNRRVGRAAQRGDPPAPAEAAQRFRGGASCAHVSWNDAALAIFLSALRTPHSALRSPPLPSLRALRPRRDQRHQQVRACLEDTSAGAQRVYAATRRFHPGLERGMGLRMTTVTSALGGAEVASRWIC
eukprot:363751-Chlamydomonas_euryale.AAC.5